MTTKRYRYIGKERDDESGFYYMGARYYCPWLARWLAPDPINNEWYNQCKGVPQRNRERDFMELTCSSYEYCYANPMRFIDPNGEQATPEQNASSQHPVGYQNELTTQYEFSYKWGGNVTRATDESNGREYSILKQQYGGKEHYFSWVNTQSGEADEFTGWYNNKTTDGKWNGYWQEYLPSETIRSQAGIATADLIGKGFVGITIAAIAAPVAINGGVFSVGLSWSSLGGAAGNLGGQLLTKDGSFTDRMKDVNWLGVAAAAVFKNPLGEELVGNAFSFSTKSGFSYTAGINGGTDYIINVTVGASVGKYVDVGLGNGGLSTFSGVRTTLSLFGRTGARALPFGVSTIVNTTTETVENVVTDNLKNYYEKK